LGDHTVLYRGVNQAVADQLIQGGVGSQFSDHGYWSTSTDPKVAEKFVSYTHENVGGAVIEIHAPPGTNGLVIGGYEREILLSRDSRFEITRIDGSGNRTLIRLNYLGRGRGGG